MRFFVLCVGLTVSFLTVSLFVGPALAAVDMDWVTISGGNSQCDPQGQGCFGKVDYTYRVGKYEVTNTQYAAFLNAVASTDGHGLYNSNMALANGGISRSGSAGAYAYGVSIGQGNKPVNYVSFYDSLRFANWLHNDQPVGPQSNSTTEDGAYTLTSQGMYQNQVTRNASASVFLTSEDEWYKAAYYDNSAQLFSDYATESGAEIACSTPDSATNSANCSNMLGMPTIVGAYLNSISASGTFDQNGNVSEWTEARYGSLSRVLRGGSFLSSLPLSLSSSSRSTSNSMFPGQEFVGFRVASVVPEPSTALLMGIGLIGISNARRRSRHQRV
jgi:formylglycine-generating enzyme required for sulfatase activity